MDTYSAYSLWAFFINDVKNDLYIRFHTYSKIR